MNYDDLALIIRKFKNIVKIKKKKRKKFQKLDSKKGKRTENTFKEKKKPHQIVRRLNVLTMKTRIMTMDYPSPKIFKRTIHAT